MGVFSKLKAQVEAAQAAGNAMAGVEPVSDIPEFVAPWPQEEVDRLLQGPGPIGAIMLGSRHQVLEDGERIGRMRVHVRLRPRGPEGTLGDEVTVKASVSSWVATLLEPGLDIPVERDPSTGAITKVASKQLTEELRDARRRPTRSARASPSTRPCRGWPRRRARSATPSPARGPRSRLRRRRATPGGSRSTASPGRRTSL